MSAIVGWVDFDSDLANEGVIIKHMADAMAGRGPDASGICLFRHAAFGHRRLSVIDPEGGSQPMTKRFGPREYTIVYNGELFNAKTSETSWKLGAIGSTAVQIQRSY